MRGGRILVPTDFSKTANKAFRYACTLSKTTGASLIALHVIAPVYYLEPADAAALVRESRAAAQKQFGRLKPSPARAMIETGIPHEVIAETARTVGADLIVMGTHGRSGLNRLMIGSVAENVVRHAPCPVLTVRG